MYLIPEIEWALQEYNVRQWLKLDTPIVHKHLRIDLETLAAKSHQVEKVCGL